MRAIASGTAQCACTSTVFTRRPLTTTSRRRTAPLACACASRAARRSQPTKAMPTMAPEAFRMNSLRVGNAPPVPVMSRCEFRLPEISFRHYSVRGAIALSWHEGRAASMNSTPIGQLRIQLITAIAVIMVSIWGTVAYQLASERHAELRLQRLRIQWTRDPKRFAEAVAVERKLRKDAFVQVAVIGADGWLAFSDLPGAKERVFLGDPEHFKTHRGGGPDRLYISDPLTDRVSGKPSIQFTRPILDGKGRFAGVLVLSVSPQALIRVYQGLNFGANGFVGIRRVDNTPLLRWPEPGRAQSTPLTEIPPEVFKAGSGIEIRRGVSDGLERIYSYRRVPDFPLYAVVGQSLDSVLVDFYRGRLFYLSAGAFGSLVVLLLGLMMLSSLKRGEDVEG